MSPQNEHQELKEILLDNQRLLVENNEILKKLHRAHVRNLWLKVAWFVFIVIVPFIMLYYYIAPMYSSISGSGSSVNVQDMQEINKLLQGL